MKSFLRLFANNYLYILWFLIHFTIAWLLFGAGLHGFIASLVLYLISVIIAFSPIGEKILRMTEGARRLETNEHKEYLLPLFEEVYEEAKKVYAGVPKIEICIVGEMTVNAFALGRHTIAINQGAIESLSPEELQSIMAHEIGHIVHGHTKALLLNVVGNGIFTIFIICMEIGMLIQDFVYALLANNWIFALLSALMRFVFRIGITAFSLIGLIILAINSRRNEFQADKFALECGFGEDLLNTLYYLQKYGFGDKMSLIERLKSSHPHINQRIERLESQLEAA